MNKIAFIYPGQGAQKAGMGKDFYAYSPLAAELLGVMRLVYHLIAAMPKQMTAASKRSCFTEKSSCFGLSLRTVYPKQEEKGRSFDV